MTYQAPEVIMSQIFSGPRLVGDNMIPELNTEYPGNLSHERRNPSDEAEITTTSMLLPQHMPEPMAPTEAQNCVFGNGPTIGDWMKASIVPSDK